VEAEVTSYTIIIEDAGTNFCAYVPDLPGCIGAADSVEELKDLMREAIQFHIEGLREEGEAIPTPSTRAAEVPVTF
jgi:predicted RNase H-like HicB family nuclease